MNTLAEIEAAVEALPVPQQQVLLRHLAQRLEKPQGARPFPIVPASGRPITQQEIDDAAEAD